MYVVCVRSPLFWDVAQRRFLVTDVSGKPISPTFKGQAFQKLLSMSLVLSDYKNVARTLHIAMQ